MDKRPNNPLTNQLGPGITEDQVNHAVAASGYPLQMLVCDIFRSIESRGHEFQISEEWCFIDRDTNKLRNLDLLATMRLYDLSQISHVRPRLTILVECKQSALPYVFFESENSPRVFDFPLIAGLRRDKISVTLEGYSRALALPVIRTLDLQLDDFQNDPPICYNLSKCVRTKGKELELSGTEAYNAVVLPLVKALQYFPQVQTPRVSATKFNADLALSLAVLDAPMVSVKLDSGTATLTASPWMRVLRHENLDAGSELQSNKIWALDVVHKDFLAKYLKAHLIPFARRFAERVLRHQEELATSTAIVADLGGGGGLVEAGMRPMPPKKPAPVPNVRVRMTTPSRKR